MIKRQTYIDATRDFVFTGSIGLYFELCKSKLWHSPTPVCTGIYKGHSHVHIFQLSEMLTGGEKRRGHSTGMYFSHKVKTLLTPHLFFECIAISYKHFALHSMTLQDGLWLMLILRCNGVRIDSCRQCLWRVHLLFVYPHSAQGCMDCIF